MKNIKHLFTLGVLFSSLNLMSQDYLMTTGIIHAESGYFYDSGGENQGSRIFADDTLTFIPTNQDSTLQFIFELFDFNSYYDNYLEIYDGLSTEALLIGRFDHGDWNFPDTVTATNTDRALTFVFHCAQLSTYINWKASFNSITPNNSVAPKARFSWHTDISPTTIQFHEYCTDNPSSWHWDFGDGVTSTERNPTHVYPTEGVYDVTLKVSNIFGSDSIFKMTKTVNVNDYLMSNDTIYTNLGRFFDSGGENNDYKPYERNIMTVYPQTPGMNMQFIVKKMSLQSPTDWLRVYDGSSTNAKLLAVFYNTDWHDYTIDTITATNCDGALTFQFYSHIPTIEGWWAKLECVEKSVCLKKPVANFNYSTNETQPLQVMFTDNSSNQPDTWFWDFGDGTTSNLANPVHSYQVEGIYLVTFIATNNNGNDKIVRYVGTNNIGQHIISNDTVTADYGYFYDKGGEDWEYWKYDNNNYINVFKPLNNNNSMQFVFERLNLNVDTIYVYDGYTTDSSKLICKISELPNYPITPYNEDGVITFRFKAQSKWGSGAPKQEKFGWRASFKSLPKYKLSFKSEVNGKIEGLCEQYIPQDNKSFAVRGIPNYGYYFLEWQDNEGDFISNANPLTIENIDTDYQISAVFSPKEYKIIFDANTGVGSMPNQVIAYETTETLNSNLFTKTGYDFAGWANNKDLQIANIFVDNGEYTKLTTGNDTLYALWQPSLSSISSAFQNEIKIYPNPVNELLNIKVHSKYEVYLYNIKGELVFQKHVRSVNDQIDLSNLNRGTYFLSIVTANNIITEKIIKQ
jgi:uncharacterized repeat protein (TIGR02543 family)